MIVERIDFKASGHFSSLFCDYVDEANALRQFGSHPPSLDGLFRAIQNQNVTSEQRELVNVVLRDQYKGVELQELVAKNMELLRKPNTFTVTTGHQLSLLGGPLFWVYKLITTVKLTERLREAFPDFSFVPIYWLASEDYDFEEIRTVRFFGKDYRWEREQHGPLGRIDPSSLTELFEQFPEHIVAWENIYKTSSTLAEATRRLADLLLGDQGLLVLDADDPRLKRQFVPVIQDDLFHHTAYHKIRETSEQLTSAGYSAQINPREINFFYMEDGLRERIVREGEVFNVLNTGIAFSETEIKALIQKSPEKFSPNVALRPVYQQMILPNIAYVGGPAEIAYWLQLKSVFDHYEVPYPVLLPRLSAVLLRRPTLDRMNKLGIGVKDVFQGKEFLRNTILQRHAADGLEFTEEERQLRALFASVRQKAEAADKSLSGFVGAEEAKVLKILEHTANRIKKAEEQKHEVELRQAEGIYEAFFPGGTMQERKESLLSFYFNNPSLIARLLESTDPFDFSICIEQIS